MWCHLFLLLNWALPLSAFQYVWRSKAKLARAALITSSARGRCVCQCVCGSGCVVRICKELLAFPKIARLTFLLTLMLIIPHKFPKANWYVCVCVCARRHKASVYLLAGCSVKINFISVYLWKCSRLEGKQFFPVRFGIQNNIKADFSFTSFDPRDFPTDTSQLKGMTSLFIKGTLTLCSCLFRRGKSRVEITSSQVVCSRWKNANECLFTSECMARCFLHSCRLTTLSSPGGNVAQHHFILL